MAEVDRAADLVTVRQVWAIVRIDASDVEPYDLEDLAQQFIVRDVVFDEEVALREVARLNELNRDRGTWYGCQVTRLRDVRSNIVSAGD